jgi:UDP-glucose 4-epimerase
MSKVLITGGAGFIGYHLANRLLAEDYQIDLLDNLSRGVVDNELRTLVDNPRIRLLNRDSLRPDAFDGLGNDYRYIYHLAAIIGVANVLDRPYAVLRDNILMLSNILTFARQQAALKRIVFASTSEVYAGTLQYFTLPIPTPESTPLAVTELAHPRTSYMLSKIYGEALCHHSGVPFTIVRPHNIYGPRMGMSHVIPELLNKAYHAPDDGSLDVFSVDHRRTFCYIADGVELIKRAAESGPCLGRTLNIGNQDPEFTIGHVAEVVLQVSGKRLKINPKPATPGSPMRRCPDMSTTISLTGYTPQVKLEKGVEFTYDWYRSNIFSGTDVGAK